MSPRLASHKISTNIGAIVADDLIDSDDEMGNDLTLVGDSDGLDDEGLDDEDVYGEDGKQSDEDDENSDMDDDSGNEDNCLDDDDVPKKREHRGLSLIFPFLYLFSLPLAKSVEVDDDDALKKCKRKGLSLVFPFRYLLSSSPQKRA
jgi:hypothetical protein